ncbi:MAG: transporter [Bacteroidota bacterium]
MRFFLAALAVLLAAPLAAQPLRTDRPTFTVSPEAVAPGRLQVEFGAVLESVSPLGDIGISEVRVPSLLARFGLLPGIEIRVAPPDYVRFDTEAFDVSTDGFSDPSVGLKATVGTFGGLEVGVLAHASLPLGEDGFSNERVVPGVIVTGDGALTETVSVGAQIETVFFGEGNAPFGGDATVGGTVLLGYATSPRTGIFAELVLEDEVGGVIDPYALVHTGTTLLLTPDAQLDAHAGIGLAGYAPDYLIGVGASIRL